MSDGVQSFESIIERDGRLVYSNVGTSMLPLIRQGRDLLVIEKPSGRLKKYDIPLYKRTSGQYVLHRIIKVRENDYVICGDNRIKKEYGVTDGQIVGVLTAIIRNGKEKKLDSFPIRLFARIHCALYPLRYAVKKTGYALRRLKGSARRNNKN